MAKLCLMLTWTILLQKVLAKTHTTDTLEQSPALLRTNYVHTDRNETFEARENTLRDFNAHMQLNNDSCTRIGQIDGCNVVDGKAVCRTADVNATISSLPPCVYDLRLLLLQGKSFIKTVDFHNLDFGHLSNLSRLNIGAVDTNTYHAIVARCKIHDATKGPFKFLNNLRFLQINLMFERHIDGRNIIHLLSPLKSLNYLAVNGAKNVQLGLVAFRSYHPLQELHLRHAQSLEMGFLDYKPTVHISYLFCALGRTLELLDLSYNSIVALVFTKTQLDCFQRLKVLDLRENYIHTCVIELSPESPPESSYHCQMQTLKIAHIMISYSTSPFSGDDFFIEENNTQYKSMMSSQVLQTSWMTYLFLDYLSFVSNECNLKLQTVLNCYLPIASDFPTAEKVCKLRYCVLGLSNDSDINEQCNNKTWSSRNKYNEMQADVNDVCHTDCIFGLPLPFPPWIQTLTYSDYHTTINLFETYKSMIPLYKGHTYKLCIHRTNNLKYVDFSNTKLHPEFEIMVSNMLPIGFKKLEIVNISNIGMSQFSDEFFFDMSSLKILNISRNRISNDGSLNETFFQMNVHLTQIDLSHMGINMVAPSTFSHLKKLRVIDMSSNNLKGSFDIVLSYISLLDLSNNQIETLNPRLRSTLVRISQHRHVMVDLSGNPLSCGCENIDFLEWLQTQSTDTTMLMLRGGPESYHCDNMLSKPLIIDMDLAKLRILCKGDYIRYIYVAFGTLAGVLVIALPYVVYRKRWLLRHFFYVTRERVKWKFCCRGKLDPGAVERGYEYDVFISYSNEDEDRIWVHLTLVPQLENTYGFKACIHHRDFLGGRDIADNIRDNMQKSRKVLAIMSPDFLRSNWCSREIQMADTMDQEQGTNKVTFVMFRDVCGEDVPAHIALLMSSRTYISAGPRDQAASERLFWRRLVDALYADNTRRPAPVTVPRGYTNLLV